MVRIRDAQDSEERKILARNWLKFAIKSVIKKRRSETCGYDLFILSEEKEKMFQSETVSLLMKHFNEKTELSKMEKIKLRWLSEALKMNKMIESGKKVAVEMYKTKNSKVKKIIKFLLRNLSRNFLNQKIIQDLLTSMISLKTIFRLKVKLD